MEDKDDFAPFGRNLSLASQHIKLHSSPINVRELKFLLEKNCGQTVAVQSESRIAT